MTWSSKLGKSSKKSIYKKTPFFRSGAPIDPPPIRALARYKTPENGCHQHHHTLPRLNVPLFSPTAPNVAQTARVTVPLARSYVHLAGRRWLQCWAL